MTVLTAPCGDVTLAYETFGSSDDPTLLLVMGLATQMLGWQDGFCAALASEGFHVVRFDNRDIGLSTHLHAAGVPDLESLWAGEHVEAAYTLADMADDAIALLDWLGVSRAHVVGASMGGMIAQEMALRHPDRVRSLTSIMSTPAPHIGVPTPEARDVLLAAPATTVEEAGDQTVSVYRVVGSPGYPLDEDGLRARAEESFRRANDPAGVARQLLAIQVSGDRTARLRETCVPTLVIHGQDDPLVQLEGGRATAEAVDGARLLVLPGMGHDLPEQLWPTIAGAIVEHARGSV